jgi:hypothetical protein
MAITTPCYCTREAVARAVDIKATARLNWQIDRAIQSAARNIEGHLHRKFYPLDTTRYFDWPNRQNGRSWRLWLDQHELIAVDTLTAGGVTIPADDYFLYPVDGPPYNRIEVDLSSTSSFTVGATTQRDIAVAGTFGHSFDTDPAGTLAAAVSTTTATSVTVSDGSLIGVGDLLIADDERMLVYERATIDTGQTNLAGAATASASDEAITVSDGTVVHVGEVLLLGSERLLIVDVTGTTVTVKRAWDGTTLATHAPGTALYAYRTLSVRRGQLGTTAATHTSGVGLAIHRVPSLVQDLAVAESAHRVMQETGGYVDAQGEGTVQGVGAALPDLWGEVETAYGRKARIRAV